MGAIALKTTLALHHTLALLAAAALCTLLRSVRALTSSQGGDPLAPRQLPLSHCTQTALKLACLCLLLLELILWSLLRLAVVL
mmetsp:Transcript_47742/g.125063  ORF Transcript_47742/g.125063 Transcript_47742/m.125063 type:complete len:83 (+) Transcript_47742:73-321(+)